MLEYYLGVHQPNWLEVSEQTLFVSHRRLRKLRSLPRARVPWALDSGAFTEVGKYGGFSDSPAAYVAAVERYRDEIGNLVFASPQDWMCEAEALAKTGLSVMEHQRRTVNNYLKLMSLNPSLPWIPVVQGSSLSDYWRHVDQYARRRIYLDQLPRVGVGSVCRRNNKQPGMRASQIVHNLAVSCGLRLHGYGIAADELAKCGGKLLSADSLAWSSAARSEKRGQQNSFEEALLWLGERVEPHLRAGFCPVTGASRRGQSPLKGQPRRGTVTR